MTSLTIIRRIAAPPPIVFDAFLQPDAIRQWWGPDGGPVLHARTDIRVGGAFNVRFRMLDDSEHESSGEYLELDRPRRIVMSWRWSTGGMPDEVADSRIEIELRPIAAGTELSFTHALLQNEESRAAHEQGWNGALDKLEQMVATDATQAA